MSEAAAQSGFGSGPSIARLLSDDRLARQAASGDERAFAAIFDRYHQRLYRYCLATVGDSQDAQEALQNTMVKALRALPGEQRRIQLRPWLYRIAHNESIDLLRRRRDTRQLDAELPAQGPGLAEDAASRERLRRLISDLDELPERQRGALVMRELGGLDFAEIGTALGTSAAVARQTLYEARLGLQKMDEGREMSCETVTKALSDRDGRVTRRRDLRAHLRSCASCRRFREEIEGRERDLAALSPLPVAVAAGLLHGLFGGGGGGGGLAGALGGGAAKSLGASAAFKGAATVAVVAAIGVSAADRGGLIHLGLPGEGGSQSTQTEQQAGTGSAGAQPGSEPTGSGSAAVKAGVGSDGARRLGASRAAKPGTGKAAPPDSANANVDAVPAAAPQGSPIAHPHGRGHEKQLPSASAHGQQTAASHKTASHGSTGAKRHGSPSHPPHPVKPPHPAQPSSPGAEKKASTPPASDPGPESHAAGNAATQAAGAEEAPPQGEIDEKP
jgi:RNA polymerase sigma factor (sigma-70 family)